MPDGTYVFNGDTTAVTNNPGEGFIGKGDLMKEVDIGKGGLFGDFAANLGDILGGFVGFSAAEGVILQNINSPIVKGIGNQEGMNSVKIGNQAINM